MSKTRISIVLIGISLLLLAGILKAEEDKNPRLITVVYDMHRFSLRDLYNYQVIVGVPEITETDEGDDEWIERSILKDIRAICQPMGWNKPMHQTIIAMSDKLIITHTIQVQKEVERYLATILPRRRAYSMKLVVFRKPGYFAGGFNGLSKMGVGGAAARLYEAGFEKVYDTVASLRTDEVTELHDYEERTYIAEYEGLIATFSTILDPVVRSMWLGYEFRAHLQETQTGVRLHLAQFAYGLEKMETIMVGKYVVEKPTITSSKWQRTFEFTGPSLKVASYFSKGFHQVMFVELLEE